MTDPTLSRDEVLAVAALARLTLDEHEVGAQTAGLGRIVDLVAALDDGAPPAPLVDDAQTERCPRRADRIGPGLTRHALLAQAPAADEELLLAPPVLPRDR